MRTVHDFSALTLEGRDQPLSAYAGQALLIVNVASRCGFTPQYTGLEALWQRYRERGLTVLGFPCNQFGAQEPGNAEEIRQFCSLSYPVSFPLFAKVEVNGAGAHPLWQHLCEAAPGLLGTKAVKWNFTKFLVDAQGRAVSRHAPATAPEKLAAEIEALLPR